MSTGLLVDTTALVFASFNIVMLLSILSRVTSIDEAPRAWNFLTLGMALVIIQFAIKVFVLVNPYFDFLGMQMIASAASLLGFGFLFLGIYRVWGVVYA